MEFSTVPPLTYFLEQKCTIVRAVSCLISSSLYCSSPLRLLITFGWLHWTRVAEAGAVVGLLVSVHRLMRWQEGVVDLFIESCEITRSQNDDGLDVQ